MKVEQFIHANQFHLYGNGKDILQSYDSKVVEIEYLNGKQVVTLGRDWDYSTTTSKHVYAFLEEYSKIRISDTNKRQYINRLIEEYKNDKKAFVDKYNFIILYTEEMH